MFERSGINLMASNQISAQTRVQVLLEYVHEKDMDFEEVAEARRTRLQQMIQLAQLQNEANQVRVFLFRSFLPQFHMYISTVDFDY
jgi:triple functional domain protein